MKELLKETLLKDMKEKEKQLKNITIYYNKYGNVWPAIGYFFDSEEKKWKVFETSEYTKPFIVLTTDTELQAIEELYNEINARLEVEERNRKMDNN